MFLGEGYIGDGYIRERKKELRRIIKNRLKSFDNGILLEKSKSILSTFFDTEIWKNSRAVFTYLSIPEEVNTWILVDRALKEKKEVFIPRVNGKNLIFHKLLWDKRAFTQMTVEEDKKNFKKWGYKGIYEPTENLPSVEISEVCTKMNDSSQLVIVVPGLAFDKHRRRLGRGGGFYDRFLSKIKESSKSPVLVSLAFSFQIVDEVPVEVHDIPVDIIFTESFVIGKGGNI